MKSVIWCPSVVKGVGAALATVSTDGKSVFLFDSLTGSSHCVYESPKLITALNWLDGTTLSLGTIDGELLQFNLEKKTEYLIEKLTDSAIFGIAPASFLDANGRFFYKGRLALDDGILQPRALLENEKFIFFVKWKNVYQFEKEKGNITVWTLEEVNSVFVDAILVDSLICITDSKELIILTNEGLKRISRASDGTATPVPVSDDEEGDGETEAVIENDSDEMTIERDRVFGVCSHRGRMAAVFSSSNKKSAWIEVHEISSEEQETTIPIFKDVFVKVSCPLCPDSNEQKLKTTALTCTRGHPISICCDSLTRIDSPSFYRCRRCNRSYKVCLDSCTICGFFLGKNK